MRVCDIRSLVSCPVYTTKPCTHSVLRSAIPLSIKFSFLTEIGSPLLSFKEPSQEEQLFYHFELGMTYYLNNQKELAYNYWQKVYGAKSIELEGLDSYNMLVALVKSLESGSIDKNLMTLAKKVDGVWLRRPQLSERYPRASLSTSLLEDEVRNTTATNKTLPWTQLADS